jgi:hypothetical protein
MVMVTNPAVISRSALGLSMVDTIPINISLSYDGATIDTFIASIDLVNTSKAIKASLQKTLDDTSIIHISPISHNYNNAP